MALATFTLAVPNSTGPSNSWTAATLVRLTALVTAAAANPGDAITVYGSNTNTGHTNDEESQAVATVVVTSKGTTVAFGAGVLPEPAYTFYSAVRTAGTSTGLVITVIGDDGTGGGGGGGTVNQGNPNAGGALAWPVTIAGSTGAITVNQGTSPWVTSNPTQLPAALVGGRLDVNIGAGSVAVIQSTSPWVTSNPTQLPAALVGGRLDVNVGNTPTVNQGTSPWVTSNPTQLPAALVGGRLDVNIGAGSVTISGTVAVTQSTSPWVTSNPTQLPAALVGGRLDVNVGNTPTVNQGTSPWVTSNPTQLPAALVGGRLDVNIGAGSVSITGTVGVTQSTSPWVVSTTQLPGALVGGRLDVNVGNTPSVTVSGSVAVTQSTSPWVTSNPTQLPAALVGGRLDVNIGAGTVAVTQSTSPWVVSGTVTANQGTSPWVSSNPTQLPAALVGGRLDVNVGAALPTGSNLIGYTNPANPWSIASSGTFASAGVTILAAPGYLRYSNIINNTGSVVNIQYFDGGLPGAGAVPTATAGSINIGGVANTAPVPPEGFKFASQITVALSTTSNTFTATGTNAASYYILYRTNTP